MDQLRIKDLEVYAYHGVFPAEKELGQRFVLDLWVDYEMTRAARTGDLEASIHYGILAEQLTEWMQAEKIDLIETVAFQLVQKIFESYAFVEKVRLELKNLGLLFLAIRDLFGDNRTEKKTGLIGLGTNMGDKQLQLETALEKIKDRGIRLLQTSTRIETEPWGGVEQDTFLNQVAEVETWMTPEDLLETLLAIEQEMGRVREVKWGPRVIDLDLLYMEDTICYSPSLILPHPYVAERAFVLESLNEIAPHFVDPVQRKPIRQLWEAVK